MKKVLIFTYYWPPAGGVAVQRWLKFSKYLPEFGWEPIIVTVENGSYPYYDESLLKEISPSLRVYRTKTFEPFELYNLLRGKRGKSLPVVSVGSKNQKSFFQKISEYIRANYFVPDARKGWIKYAVKQAEEIFKEEKIDIVVTTGPPHSAHLIGLQLKKKFGIKWLADFRDPWTGIFYNHILPRTDAAKQKDKTLENQVLEEADEVTVISEGMRTGFQDRAKKISLLYNGYDEEDFLESEEHKNDDEIFIIRYVGNLMASQNVSVFWKALSTYQNEIRVEVIGRVDEEVKKSMEENGISQMVSYSGFVEHSQAVKLMQSAQLLLFVIPDVKENELILTGKLFEYLASKTEIISFGPVSGNAATLLHETGRTKMIDYTDEDEVKLQLKNLIERFSKQQVMKYSNTTHEKYSRKQQTKILADKLDIIIKQSFSTNNV